MHINKWMSTIALCATAALAPSMAHAQADSFPERTITVVVPWPAGGFTDKLGRLVAEKMAASFGKPVVVENRPGASAGIGSEYVMRAAPDGYTLLVTSTDGTVKMLQGKGTDPVTEFTQITMLASQPVTLSVGPKFKGATLAQFVEEAKRNPGALAYASNGEGGATHYGMEILAKQAGIKQASGKRHMAPVPGAAGEAPYVATPRQRELYREINPNATDDEINAAYGEFYKQ